MRLKQLKTLDTSPIYSGKGRYRAIPHYDAVKALVKAAAGTFVFDTVIEHDGLVMVCTIRPSNAEPDVLPVAFVASSHDGRQSVEAFFGHEIRPVEGGPHLGMVTSSNTVSQAHTVNCDLDKWAGDVLARLASAAGHVRPIQKWWAARKADSISMETAVEHIDGWSEAAPPRPFRSMAPLPKRGIGERIQSLLQWNDFRLGMTEAGLLAATLRVIGESKSALAALYRKNGLLLRLGEMTPPEVYEG